MEQEIKGMGEEGAEAKPKVEPGPMAESMRKVFLASLGALDLAREESEKLVSRLADRGERVRGENREWVTKMRARRRARRAA